MALSPKEALAQKQMLDADKRLDRLITLDIISVPLDEVLQKESSAPKQDTRNTNKSAEVKLDAVQTASDPLALTASHNCEALKLQIRLNHRALRTLMTALAEMLPGVWTRTRDGYNLSLTEKAVIARAEWWRLFLGEREKALALQRRAILTAMQTKAERRKDNDRDSNPDMDQSNPAIEKEEADQHDFFHSLPAALKEQIAANMEETAFYEVGHVGFCNDGERSGTIGWLSQMSPETQERFKTTMQNTVNRLAQAPPAEQKYAIQAQQDMAAFDPSQVYFIFQNGGSVVMATPINSPAGASSILDLSVPTTVSTLSMLPDQTQLADAVYGGAKIPPVWQQLALKLQKTGSAVTPDQKMLVYQVCGMGEAAPLVWKQLAAYQRGRVWPNVLPDVLREESLRVSVTEVPLTPLISQAAQTDWLGERGGMEYVCDYYSHGGYSMPESQRKLLVKRPLATELDEMAAKHDISWRKNPDGVVLIRNNRWYRDDGLEVPQPLLRKWFAAMLQVRRQEAVAQTAVPAVVQTPSERTVVLKQQWDWVSDVFRTLTPWQLWSGLPLFQPEERDLAPQNDATAAKMFEKLKHKRSQGIAPPGYDEFAEITRMPPFYLAFGAFKKYPHTAHLYGSLDDAGRTALLEGRLAASSLSGPQVSEAATLLPLLPQALQSFPADSVLLSLPCPGGSSNPVIFGQTPPMPLKLITPLPSGQSGSP